jgi:hypothetical protein
MIVASVTALEPFVFEDRQVERDETFDVQPIEAVVLLRQRKVKVNGTRSVEPEPRRKTPEQPVTTPTPRRRRRSSSDDETPAQPDPPRARRAYRRRDLVPEE